MNEKIWYNDGKRLPVNLRLMVGASNEFPEDEEGLAAFHDRFVIRHWTQYIQDEGNQNAMLKASVLARKAGTASRHTCITLEEIDALRAVVNEVDLTDETIDAFQKLIFELRSKHAIVVSDRRLVACMHIAQANAALEGRNVTSPEDLEHLAYVLWEKEEDIETIQSILLKMMNPLKDKANKLMKDATSIYQEVLNMKDKTQRANRAIDARNTLNKVGEVMQKLKSDATKNGSSTVDFLENKIKEIQSMSEEIVNKCLFNLDSAFDADIEF